nr:uncharacterized protein LOC107377668 [Nothobranchius furzeri]
MGRLLGFGCLFLFIALSIDAQKKYPTISIRTKCLGNVMRVDVGPLEGNYLEVAGIINNSAVVLTPSLASQCGFSMKTDQLGNALIYVSLQNCFTQNMEDKMFTTALQLRVQGGEVYQVAETCSYDSWASREIFCDYNFMEVSVRRAALDDYALPEHTIPKTGSKTTSFRRAAEKRPLDAGFRVTTVVFSTPGGEIPMSVADVQKRGYGIANTPTRLVLRSPLVAPETFTQNVAGIPMSVLKSSTIFEKRWLATQIDTSAACPVQEGSVFFTDATITWYLPRHIDPLISSGSFNLLELNFGIKGQRLDAGEMQARQYSVSLNEFYIITEIPIGAVGGYYKSRVQDNLYYVSYMIEPMLELLWTEDLEDTRYKVFLNIVTHFLPRPPQLMDNTIPEERMFKMTLGHFASDVALINISFPNEVLSMADCSARGFNVLEYMSPNSTMKVFTLQVPFTYPAVHQRAEDGVAVYSLHLTFGLLVLNKLVPFSHAASLQAFVQELVPPSVSGGCDNHNFYVLVKFGTKNYSFQTLVGKSFLTPTLAQQYGYMENGTHFSFVVPFSAPDVVVEAIESSSVKARIGVVLRNPETNALIQDFSVACHFPTALTECFPNGTMTALAVKLESVPSLNPSQLTLADSRCHPSSSDDRHAYFVFTVNSCGTTRKFLPNAMLYENEISLPNALLMKKDSDSEEPDYHLKVTCLYEINTSQAVSFNTRPRRSEPYAENSKGHLEVVMKLSLDDSYREFQPLEVYPIAKYLQQPLYFEVELTGTTNPQVSLELENCWATQDDRTSQPRWNLIIDGCPNPVDPYQVIFHPVWADARIKYPSHFKRFEVQMFAFADGKDDLHNRLFIHCDVVICDVKKPLGGVCSGQCSIPEGVTKGQRRDVSDVYGIEHVTVGPMSLNLS